MQRKWKTKQTIKQFTEECSFQIKRKLNEFRIRVLQLFIALTCTVKVYNLLEIQKNQNWNYVRIQALGLKAIQTFWTLNRNCVRTEHLRTFCDNCFNETVTPGTRGMGITIGKATSWQFKHRSHIAFKMTVIFFRWLEVDPPKMDGTHHNMCYTLPKHYYSLSLNKSKESPPNFEKRVLVFP